MKRKIKCETFLHGDKMPNNRPFFRPFIFRKRHRYAETRADGLTLVSLSGPFVCNIRRPKSFTFFSFYFNPFTAAISSGHFPDRFAHRTPTAEKNRYGPAILPCVCAVTTTVFRVDRSTSRFGWQTCSA